MDDVAVAPVADSEAKAGPFQLDSQEERKSPGDVVSIASESQSHPMPSTVPDQQKLSESYRLQLGSERSEAKAHEVWERLSSQYPDLLKDVSLTVMKADLGSKGVFYRVQAGSIRDAVQAQQRCAELIKLRAECLVLKSPWATAAVRVLEELDHGAKSRYLRCPSTKGFDADSVAALGVIKDRLHRGEDIEAAALASVGYLRAWWPRRSENKKIPNRIALWLLRADAQRRARLWIYRRALLREGWKSRRGRWNEATVSWKKLLGCSTICEMRFPRAPWPMLAQSELGEGKIDSVQKSPSALSGRFARF